jgi:cellulose synthase/poly-beta-1,6-N-acetylglucosamine synthase-like glycosyltransferase
VTAVAILFWLCIALVLWTQVGYALVLGLIVRARPGARLTDRAESTTVPLPKVSLIVAAHNEQSVIAGKVANALALDYPREQLEVIVACDGCTDETAERAREAGADLVLNLPRAGKIRAQDQAVERARGVILAFSDANCLWQSDALRLLFASSMARRVLATQTRRASTGAMR